MTKRELYRRMRKRMGKPKKLKLYNMVVTVTRKKDGKEDMCYVGWFAMDEIGWENMAKFCTLYIASEGMLQVNSRRYRPQDLTEVRWYDNASVEVYDFRKSKRKDVFTDAEMFKYLEWTKEYDKEEAEK